MTSKDLIKKYLDFFAKKGHTIIPSAPLIPENDPTALFISAGMQPLVPFLLGEAHPAGKRLADVQICLRTDDIDSVGDTYHHTFFEMLGNWSLGDYWKKESISWSYEFLTKELGISPDKLSVTCFAGDDDAPKDTESAEIWKSLGIPDERIFFLPKKDNWWGPVGETGPCGPDSEIFFDMTGKPHGKNCRPGDDCGRYFEIWNNVFIQYNKIGDGKYEALKQRNVDTGMGVDRTTAVLNGLHDDYLVKDLWGEIILAIEDVSGKKYQGNEKPFRIIADHIRAATFLIAEGVPAISDDKHGSVLRRLIDRALGESRKLGVDKKFLSQLSEVVISNYKNRYSLLEEKNGEVKNTLSSVESRVEKILVTPSQEAPMETIENLPNMNKEEILIKMRKPHEKLFDNQTIEKYIEDNHYISLPSVYAGTLAFNAKTTEGYPASLVESQVRNVLSQNFNAGEYYKAFNDYLEQHKKISRKAGERLFKGGLADHSEEVTRLHTATHLLHAALRKVLGEQVSQKGSNINVERLRFDFSYPGKLTDKKVKKVEDLVNWAIKEDMPVISYTQEREKALREGALGFFVEKYRDEVTVYDIGKGPAAQGYPFSREICGGPHVTHTGEVGHVRIIKQEKVGSGTMRIYATNRPE